MTYKEALDYIAGLGHLGSRPGLERISALLDAIGRPQDRLKFVHIAGTNGKGSCAALTASVLKYCGYKTGLFTSPHLMKYNERMQINGKMISDAAFAAAIAKVQPAADAMEDHPTEFELLTAAALQYFADEYCDIVVMEVGLGGRLDSTNVIDSCEVAVIMNIGLDHTEILGDTVEKIAAEKAEIIKPGCICVAYDQQESVLDVIRAKCKAVGAEFVSADFTAIKPEFDSLEGQVFSYKGTSCAIPLLGAHQQKNAAVVMEVAAALSRKGYAMDESDVEHGLYAVSWPARFEVLADDPYVVLDGGHNPQCAQSVAAALKAYFPDSRRVFLIGLLADKDRAGIEDILAPLADEFVCVTPGSPRALPAEQLAEELGRFGKPVCFCANVQEGVSTALEHARAAGSMVIATGSLYMSGEIRECFILPKAQED